MSLFSFNPQASDVGETHSLVPATVYTTDHEKCRSVHQVTETKYDALCCSLHTRNVFMFSVDPLTTSWHGDSFLRSQDLSLRGGGVGKGVMPIDSPLSGHCPHPCSYSCS
jgi:hypothetical protein